MKQRITWIVVAWLTALLTFGAESVRVSWDASRSNDVVGYRVYYGTNSGAYSFEVNAGDALSQAIVLPQRGRWFFAVTAYNTNLVESDFSNEVQYESKPQAPLVYGESVVRVTPIIECSTNLVDWSPVLGEPTFFPATNSAGFFRTARLTIEAIKCVKE
jgi:hypothetical protein